MTAPISLTTDPKIRALWEYGKKQGYSDQEILAKLDSAGLIQLPHQAGPSLGQQAMGMGQQVLRGAGLAGRGVMQGLGAMQQMNPFAAPERIGAQVSGRPMFSPADQATQLGLPQPRTPGERIGVAGAEGLTMAAPFGGGLGLATGGMASAAGQGAQEAGMGPLGQLAASAAVGFGIPIAGAVLSAGIRGALRGAGERRAQAEQALALVQAGDPNAAVTLGQVATGGIGQGIEAKAKSLGGGSPFVDAMKKQAQQIGARIRASADAMGPAASRARVGEAIQGGIREGFLPDFRARSAAMYNRVYSVVPPTTPVSLPATTQLMAKQNDLLGMARELSDDIVSPKFAKILTDMDQAVSSSPNGTVPFEVIKELRSRLGAMQSGEEAVVDINLRDVKRLYGTLTEDMGAAVQKAGGRTATADWNAANTFYQKGIEKIEKILQPLLDKNVPEQAFTAVMRGTREGATALRETLSSLPQASQGLLRSNILRRIGQTEDGPFNPSVFLRKFNGIDPDVRNVLFQTDPVTGVNLSALAKFAETQRVSGNNLFRPAGTGLNTTFNAVVNGLSAALGGAMGFKMGGLPGSGVGILAGQALPALAAHQLSERVLTNPRMITWLVRETKIPFGAMAQELTILVKDAQKWPLADRRIAEDLSATLTNMDWRSILLATAGADATTTDQR